MRKMLTALTAASLVLSLSGQAQAANEKYQSSYVNAFWHSKVAVDNDTLDDWILFGPRLH